MLNLWFRAALRPGNGDNIEPGRLVEQAMLLKKLEGKLGKLALLLGPNGFHGMSRDMVDPRLDFNEYDLPAIERDQV
jgi:hypothetical protein